MSRILEICVFNDGMAHDELKKTNVVVRIIVRRATNPEKDEP